MSLIEEVVGYAKANAESARDANDRETWAAHHRNCVSIRDQHAAEIERLQEAKRGALSVADERSKENVGLRAEIERLRAALRKAETVMLIVEPRSHKAEYLDALVSVREALDDEQTSGQDAADNPARR